jgi:predicted dehydrogenase
MVLSERPETHLPYARLALERGLRTYVDKPLAENMNAGREIFAFADRLGVPCYTGSAIRWSPEFLAGRRYVQERFGPPKAVYVPCPLAIELYGIHAVEMVNLFLGNDVVSVRAIAGHERQVVLMEYHDGTTAVFEHLNFVRWPSYSVTLYADSWQHRIILEEPGATLMAFAKQFVEFARGGPAPVSPIESLRLIEIVAAAKQALDAGGRIELGDVISA